MHLVLDTNILHQENLVSVNMKTLLRLVESGFVTVCVPTLVRREYVTKVVHECTAKLQAATSNVDNVLKISKISGIHSKAIELHNTLAQLRSEVAATYEGDFRNWEASYRVQEIDFEPMSIDSVIDDYFSGAPPFKSQKSREDILDAMIGKCVDSLAGRVESVGVAVKDGALRRHFVQQGRTLVFDGLDDFLSSKAVEDELARLDIEADVQAFMTVLSDSDTIEALQRFVNKNQTILDTIYLEEGDVRGTGYLEIPCFGVRVNGPIIDDVTSLQLGQLDYVGRAQFAFSFDMKAKSKVDFCANYGDFLELPYDREEAIEMTSMNGVGICDLEELRPVLIAGKLILDIGSTTTADELKARIRANDFHAFSLEFEATSASLIKN